MNKKDIVSAIAERDERLSKTLVADVINHFEDVLVEGLQKGEKIQLVGFLTVAPIARSARKGYNPQTQEQLDIAPKMGVKMSSGARLEKAVEDLEIDKFLKKK